MTAPDTPFVRYKLQSVISYTIANACRLHEVGYLPVWDQRPFEGRTVVVVGAGPALRHNAHHLEKAQRLGIPIVCVNASSSVLRSVGVRPDLMIVRESLDLADQIAESEARGIVLDVGVHPETWNATREHEAKGYAFFPCYPRHMQLCRRLGLRPLFAGTAALTSAVSLTFEMGASRVILCGVDLAAAPDGALYHDSAPRGATRATVDFHHGHMAIEGDEQDQARSERSGQRPQPSESVCTPVVASDFSGHLAALPTLQSQREWLEIEGERRKDWPIDLLNCTEAGSGIVYWRNAELGPTLAAERLQEPWELPEGTQVPEQITAAVHRDLMHEAGVLETVAREMLSEGGPDLAHLANVPNLVEGSRLIETLAEWRLLDAPRESGAKRCRYIYEAYQATAEEARKVLGVVA